MDGARDNPRKLLAEIKALVDQLRANQVAAAQIEKLSTLLDELERALHRRVRATGRRVNEGVRYAVEHVDRQPVLTEYREGGSQPFRTPKNLYDVTAEVLSGAEKALPFDEVVEAVVERVNARPGDWQVRVVLRCWLRSDPPLITRSRARYAPKAPKGFKKAAQNLWNSLSDR